MMTQLDIDVAYVLEDVPGIIGVYAVRGLERIRYAIHLDSRSCTSPRRTTHCFVS